MSKSTFIKAWLRTAKGDLELSDAIEWFRYEIDHTKGELVEFRMKSDRALDLANHNDMVAGAIVVYQFGFIKNIQSSTRICRIGNIECDFSDKRVQLSLKCTDKGIEIKKGVSYKVWSNKTLSEMCEEVASQYGLTFRGQNTTKKYAAMPQAGRSDWEFLNFVSLLEEDLYHIDISDGALTLEKNQRSKNSVRFFKLGENIINVRTQFKEVSQKPQLSSSLLGVNDTTGKPLLETKVATNELRDGKFSVTSINKAPINKQIGTTILRNQNGDKIGERPIYATTSGSDTEDASYLSKSLNEKNKAKVLTANLLIELDPMRKAGEVVTLELPVEKLSGNWFVETAQHTIDENGGFTELMINKNGTARPSKTGKDTNDGKVNNTQGSTDSKATTRVYRNVDGNIIKTQ